MKKFKGIGMFLSVVSIATLVACSDNISNTTAATNESESASTAEAVNTTPLTSNEFDQMITNPLDFKGRTVEFYGKVFVNPEKDEQGTYLQVYADPKNNAKNIIVGIADPASTIKSDDYVHVKGVVKDKFEGENMMGGTVTAPVILSDSVKVVDYATAVAPALKTIDVNETKNQSGYKITVQKIELAESETRAYISIENSTQDTASFYAFNTKLVQGSKQYEQETNYAAKYPELQSEILPGVKTEGIISFKTIDLNSGNLRLIAEGSTDDYSKQFKPFEFNISLK
ncbi:hypothetical protein ACE3MZ_07350 [Paenibacillus sp. WLX1005]|uniref:hypothetical protein n=1 Tax=Paenibacillus sp. WLX1005 TaxID=3243766 RepID=UPI003984422D